MGSTWRTRRWLLISAIVLSAVAMTVLLLPHGRGDRQTVRTGAASTPRPDPADPASYWRTDGSEPSLHPRRDLAVGFFAYGDPLAEVDEALGAPQERRVEPQELVFGDTIVSRWSFAPGASLLLEALPEASNRIELVGLTVEPDSAARVSLGRDLVAGRSTLRDAMAAWGPGSSTRVTPWTGGVQNDDVTAYLHEASWPACEGPYPLIVVIGRRVAASPGATLGDPVPAFDETVLDQPFTDVLITWADADPYTSGCR